MTPIVTIKDLSLGFGNLTLFDGLSFDVKPGSILAVVGANGSGKSTFVKTLLGLQSPITGRIEWPTDKPTEIGYLAQLTEFDRRFPIRVRDLAAMGAWQGFNPFAGLNKTTRNRVNAALEMAGILDLADHPLHTLSGGQLQRARLGAFDGRHGQRESGLQAGDKSKAGHAREANQKRCVQRAQPS